MSQEQKNIWTSKCPGEMKIQTKNNNNWIAIKMLNDENIKLFKSTSSRRVKNMMFLEDILKADGMTLMKWKHLYKEKRCEYERKETCLIQRNRKRIIRRSVRKIRKIKNEYIGRAEKSKIHIKYFDENEKQKKNSIITWNDVQVIDEGELDLNNSPSLKKCEGCIKNISKKKGSKECLIYLEGECSRVIEKRKEEGVIKPYETLNNIIKKMNGLEDTVKKKGSMKHIMKR
ncbi:hypothetical protein RhiirC2_772459 [Rhizophagus irregularis]|uniref:Uncharacterized protein n=1 Tax=Rhizophagus irregularis TaxID=588596 RepID=A0A2N1NRI0_9GLOM|nr:hypothetical protein RhiirC2_772459 [Rhizophagus irregularis]